MYFPYIRAKQYDLLALREIKELLAADGNIFPIIEPVKSDTSNLSRAIRDLNEAGLPFVLITNPHVGQEITADKVHHEVVNENLEGSASGLLAYILTSKTSESDIANFLERYGEYQTAIVHQDNYSGDTDSLNAMMLDYGSIEYNIFLEQRTGEAYRNAFTKASKVLIQDGFRREARNADYQEISFFTDLNTRYKASGYEGFGDFLTIGERYDEKGGPAHAVAIHLTDATSTSNEVSIRHFVSDETDSAKNTPGKFLEALTKLVNYVENNPDIKTDATKEFFDLYQRGHFPQLGPVKKISIKHHIETMSKFA